MRLSDTSVYQAKGRPRDRSTKLDSGAQKRLRRSSIKGYGPRPQASARLVRAAVVPPATAQRTGEHANWTAGHCAVQRASSVWTFSRWATLAPFSEFLHTKGRNFPDVFFSVHVCLWPLWTMICFMEIGPHVFEKSGRQTHTHTQTDAAALYTYIHIKRWGTISQQYSYFGQSTLLKSLLTS